MSQLHSERESELLMLAGIGALIRWLEELASLLAGPILTLGLGIALVDLFTDGRLLATTPALLFAWAVSQTVGLDAQLVGSAAKLGAAMRRRAVGAIIGYTFLVLALGVVAFQASNVFATQQAEGITTAQALGRLGMDSATWIIERSALAVVLVILSGLLRYVAPRKIANTLADERANLEREIELEPLRQRLRATRVGGWRAVGQVALHGADTTTTSAPDEEPHPPLPAPTTPLSGDAQGAEDATTWTPVTTPPFTSPERPDDSPDDPDDGGLSPDRPAAASGPVQPEPTPLFTPQSAPLPRRKQKTAAVRRRERAAAEALERERRTNAFALLDDDPQMTPNALARTLHCRWRTAYSYVVAWHRLHDERGA